MDTNIILQTTNQAVQSAIGHPWVTPSTGWDLVKYISLFITSSLGAVIVNQWIERRKNRVRYFKMEKIDFENIHVGTAIHRGKQYSSVRCATYRLKNSAELDYREVVVRMGFREGEIIHVKPKSDIIGEDDFKIDITNPKQITINIPIFNRGDVIDLRLEMADCQDIDLNWRYIGSHTGIQITSPPLRASPGTNTFPRPSSGQQGQAQVETVGVVKRCRAWIAERIHPGSSIY